MTIRNLALIATGSFLALALASPAVAFQAGRIGTQATTSGLRDSLYDGGAEPAEAAFLRGHHTYRLEGPRAALGYFEQAAAAGSPRALRTLGIMYANGEGVARDQRRALEYFYEAALRDDAVAMYALASAFRGGAGVARDDALARYWLQRSARNGYRPARLARGRLGW